MKRRPRYYDELPDYADEGIDIGCGTILLIVAVIVALAFVFGG